MGIERAIEKASKELTEREKSNKALRETADSVVALCGKSMQLMHASRVNEAKKVLNEVRLRLEKLKNYDNILVAQQEYVEAVALAHFIEGKSVPHYEKLNVSPQSYLLGLADVIGELRREVVEYMRKDDYKKASRLFEEMSSLYELLLPIRLSNSVLPGFRKKLDVARSLVEQCRRDLLMYKISKGG